MNISRKRKMINIIKPSIVVPIHYGSIVGKKEDANRFKELVDDNIEVDILLK